VAQNLGRRGGSAIDETTTHHPGYRLSQKRRKRIEECFGSLKTIARLRKVRHRISDLAIRLCDLLNRAPGVSQLHNPWREGGKFFVLFLQSVKPRFIGDMAPEIGWPEFSPDHAGWFVPTRRLSDPHRKPSFSCGVLFWPRSILCSDHVPFGLKLHPGLYLHRSERFRKDEILYRNSSWTLEKLDVVVLDANHQ
jgi:hypothetical protein